MFTGPEQWLVDPQIRPPLQVSRYFRRLDPS